MTRHKGRRAYECVVVDLNTQWDFCHHQGASPVANVDELIPAIRRVIAWVRRNGAPVVSSVESHRRCEVGDNGHPICCVDGSVGQRKLDFTILPLRVIVEVDNTFALPLDLFRHWQQVLFRKRSDDLLANPKADRLLTHLPVRNYVVFGTGVERSVKALTLGLLAREKSVTVVSDACGHWHRPTADLALRQMAAKGAAIITVDELRSWKLSRRRRYQVNGRMEPSFLPGEHHARGASANGKSAQRGSRRSRLGRSTHEYHI